MGETSVSEAAAKRWEGIPAEQRSVIMRAVAEARWGKGSGVTARKLRRLLAASGPLSDHDRAVLARIVLGDNNENTK